MEAFAISNLKRALTCLNGHLASRTYLVGESVTLADIVLTCNLATLFKVAATKEFTSEYPHVERYFWTLVNQPNFKKIVGEVAQAVKPLGLPSPQTAKPSVAEREAPKKDSAPKPKKEKAAPAPKPTPAPEVVDEEEAAPVKKPKNTLDLLPPSPMVLDNWKRLYSNTKAKDFHLAISGEFISLCICWLGPGCAFISHLLVCAYDILRVHPRVHLHRSDCLCLCSRCLLP